MSKYKLKHPLDDVDPIIMPGVNPEKPCIYIFYIDDGGCYVGKAGDKSRWQSKYSKNLLDLNNNGNWHNDEGKDFRPIHYALDNAIKNSKRISLVLFENGDGKNLTKRRSEIKDQIGTIKREKKVEPEQKGEIEPKTEAKDEAEPRAEGRGKQLNSHQKNLEEFLHSVYSETNDLWNSSKRSVPEIEKRGFQILNAPPVFNPMIFFVSLNPGFSHATQKRSDWNPAPITWPNEFGYLHNPSDFSIKFRQIFGNSGPPGSSINLQNCNASYTMFFRSKNWEEWETLFENNSNLREELEDYCSSKIQTLIELSQPKTIITFGTPAFEKMSKNTERSYDRPWGTKIIHLLRVGDYDGTRVIGLPHISGAYLDNKHLDELPALIADELDF